MTASKNRIAGTMAVAVMAGLLASSVAAEDLTMWVRETAADPGKLMVDLWNQSHDDKITLTAIPDTQLVTKLAASAQAGDAPDLVSFDLIYMPDVMKAGLLTDLTAQLAADPNYATHIQAYKDIATFEDKTYGVGFTPDVSVLAWNKDLYKAAGETRMNSRGADLAAPTQRQPLVDRARPLHRGGNHRRKTGDDQRQHGQ